MVGGLETLFVVEGEYHPVFLRERTSLKELPECGSGRRHGNWRDVKLGQDAGNSLNDVGTFMLHDHALSEEIPECTVFHWKLMSFRDEVHPQELSEGMSIYGVCFDFCI